MSTGGSWNGSPRQITYTLCLKSKSISVFGAIETSSTTTILYGIEGVGILTKPPLSFGILLYKSLCKVITFLFPFFNRTCAALPVKQAKHTSVSFTP